MKLFFDCISTGELARLEEQGWSAEVDGYEGTITIVSKGEVAFEKCEAMQ